MCWISHLKRLGFQSPPPSIKRIQTEITTGFFCVSMCLCFPVANQTVCPLFRHRQEQEKRWERETERKKLRARWQLLVCGPKSDLHYFLSASARRPLHMCGRKGGQTSSRFKHASDESFGRTLRALRDAASVPAFPFKIFEEGPSLSLRKGESANMYGDGKQTNPGACHGEAVVSSCFRRLYGGPACIWRVASNGRFFFEQLQRANRSEVDLLVDHCNLCKHWNTRPLITTTGGPLLSPIPEVQRAICPEGLGEKVSHPRPHWSVAISPPRALRALGGDLATSTLGWGTKL